MTLGPLMIDLSGQTLTTEDRALIQDPLVGGLIFFARHYESPLQMQALVSEIRHLRPDILLAVDQEGGRVQRFQSGLTQLPALSSLAALYDRDPVEARKLAETLAWLMATEILSLGLDLSFAPVLDLNKGVSEVIGQRSFHHEPQAVIELGAAYIQGMLHAGMQPVGKHFPGHGSVTADSHLTLPQDNRSLAEVEASDLRPFQALATRGLSGLMTAHIHYPQIDPHPVTFSAFWLQDILRRRCRFEGCIFSDDLSMQGAVEFGKIGDRVTAALSVGCDMALICNHRDSQKAALSALHQAAWQAQDQPRLRKMRGRCSLPYEKLLLNPNYQAAKKWVEGTR